MSTPAQLLDEVIAAVAPQLTAAGYRKSQRIFTAQADGVARGIQFQTSQLKKPEEASFTLALFVASEPFHVAYAGTPFPKNASSAEPVVQAGIGKLTSEGEPIWWALGPEVSARLVIDEVSGLLRDLALPFLQRFATEDALLHELSEGARLPGFSAMRERCRAVLLARRGRKDEAAQVLTALREANAAPGLEGFRESLDQLSQRLGLPA